MSQEISRDSDRVYRNEGDANSPASEARPAARRRYWTWSRVVAVMSAAFFTIAMIYEIRTSTAQSRFFAAMNRRISFWMEHGSSESIVFPTSGPVNIRRGYTQLPSFTRNLVDEGFHVVEQARSSSVLQMISRWQIPLPYREKPVRGLVIRDQHGNILYNAGHKEQMFRSYEEIPPLVVSSLLLVENRDLKDSTIATRSPVVDWGRMSKAGLFYVGSKLGMPLRVEGGSTLATQIEKYQYSKNGRTNSAADKLRQMIGASLLAYQGGTDTREERRRIVLDYLNSVPLAAANGYGEVFGVGNGLRVWFGADLTEATATLNENYPIADKELALREFLTLICAARAPSFYLKQGRAALEARTDFYIRELQNTGAISPEFARGMQSSPVTFLAPEIKTPSNSFTREKATNAIRTHLMNVLGIRDFYDLDGLSLSADTTLNSELQSQVVSLFEELKDPEFINAHGLRQEHTLLYGDPKLITYGFTLYERTPEGNKLRVQADTLNQPFDLNEGMKLELGSTAKLRTLAHFLEVVVTIYHQLQTGESPISAKAANDPITHWVADTMAHHPGMDVDALLQSALDRKFSGSPGTFFTGGGLHSFSNFDNSENSQFYTLRDGFAKSVNLVYVRLLRELVQYHETRLPYDTEAILNQPDNPDRRKFLEEFANEESLDALHTAYQAYHGLSAEAIVDRILGSRKTLARPMSMLYLAWNPKANAESLGVWLASQGITTTPDDAEALLNSYDPYRLNISDYGYLLDRNPLDVWCAGKFAKRPDLTWTELLNDSAKTREISSQWLFRTRNQGAQDRRLLIRFEEDAFADMTKDWQRLGYPFEHLVPSLATAIGSSADRPIALARLMGVILNNGIRQSTVREQRIHFAQDTPYETILEANSKPGEQVIDPHVAAALRQVLLGVVQNGTAASLNGLFHAPDGSLVEVGGKTGSGDNRFETFNRGGGVRSSRAVSRTGTFVFYIGTRYFGVITAYVGEDIASKYGFTSALPLAVLRLFAPSMTPLLGKTQSAIVPQTVRTGNLTNTKQP